MQGFLFRPRPILFLFLLGLFTPVLRAQDRVTETVLSNGMTIILYEDHSVPLVATNLIFKVGTKYEIPGYTGITDVCAEIYQDGTANYGTGEYERAIRSGGGTMRYATGMDFSFFAASVPSSMLDTLLKMEADRLANTEITFEKVVAARQTITRNRVTEIENTLYGRINQEIRTLSYQAHPYRIPRYGWPSDLSSLTVDDVTRHFREFFTPGNAVMALAGDFDSKKLIIDLQNYFEPIPTSKSRPLRIPVEPVQDGEREAFIRGTSDLSAMIIAYHVPGLSQDENSTMGVLIELLAAGESSRIYKKLVNETDLAVVSGGYYFGLSDPSLLGIWSIMNYGVSYRDAEDAMLEEMDRLKNEPVPPGELEKAKNMIEADFYRSLRGYGSTASNLATFQVVRGDWKKLFDNVRKTRAVTADDIMKIARKYFRRTNRTTIVLEPPDEFDSTE